MQILNFGSLNIDHVYAVDHFARAGETLDTDRYEVFAGGKGFNQSIALARAGARVAHAGSVGDDGRWLIEQLVRTGVDVRAVEVVEHPTGHAVIQVSRDGENSILIHGGANRAIGAEQRDAALARLKPGVLLLLQNEINELAAIVDGGRRAGAKIVLNPSPASPELLDLPLQEVALFVLNRGEGELLCGASEPGEITARLRERFPRAEVLLTLGPEGACYEGPEGRVTAPAVEVEAVDTTGAGDTFTGYFLAARLRGESIEASLRLACRAAAYCVARPGAAASIPVLAELA